MSKEPVYSYTSSQKSRFPSCKKNSKSIPEHLAMVSSKLLLLSVTTLVLGASMLAYITGGGDEFYFEAVSAEHGGKELTKIQENVTCGASVHFVLFGFMYHASI